MNKKQYITPAVECELWKTQRLMKVSGEGSPILPPHPMPRRYTDVF